MFFFAGLAYGPVSVIILGLSIPLASFLVTGWTLPGMLPLTLPVSAAYGLFTGLFKGKLTAFDSVVVAQVTGKLVFLVLVAATDGLNLPVLEFIRATWGPGTDVPQGRSRQKGNLQVRRGFRGSLFGTAAYVTKLLEKMSEYRYSLLLDTDRQKSRGYAGLDLMVFDAHTGKQDPAPPFQAVKVLWRQSALP